MSAVEDFALAVYGYNCDHKTRHLLEAIRDAWAQAEALGVFDSEANRWSPVCTAAVALVEGGAS